MSIYELLWTIQDYRKTKGKRYSLSIVLQLVYGELLAGTNILKSIS
jgi:hypothetical protein